MEIEQGGTRVERNLRVEVISAFDKGVFKTASIIINLSRIAMPNTDSLHCLLAIVSKNPRLGVSVYLYRNERTNFTYTFGESVLDTRRAEGASARKVAACRT